MNSNKRLHSVLLTLWDIARDNPNYNRKLWGELQVCLSSLETRNNLLCALLSDLLQCTDDDGNVMWEAASIHSPPHGFAVGFMREELQREKRPQMPKPKPVIKLDDEFSPTAQWPDVKPGSPGAEKTPLGVGDEYDVRDESDDEDHLTFDFDFD